MPKTPKLTILYTYYGQKERIPGILKELHPATKVVIVDDGSPEPLEIEGIDVYRINKDVPWNQPAARNIGFKKSEGWIVCADIDHLVTKENVKELLKMKKEKGTVYYLGREDTNSWNVYLIHKDDFEKIGGYDEDFCGHYGYDDIDFLFRCQDNLKVKEVREIKVKVFAKESSSRLDRDTKFNRRLLEKKVLE
jgi:predicted glycosyltransferase involved in capsule biosynthesis